MLPVSFLIPSSLSCSPSLYFFFFHPFVLLPVLVSLSVGSAFHPSFLSCSISLSCSLSLSLSVSVSFSLPFPPFSVLFPLCFFFCFLSLSCSLSLCFLNPSLSCSSVLFSLLQLSLLLPILGFFSSISVLVPISSFCLSSTLSCLPVPFLSLCITLSCSLSSSDNLCPAPCPHPPPSPIPLPVSSLFLSCPNASFSTSVLLPAPCFLSLSLCSASCPPGFSVFISLSHCLSGHLLLYLPVQPALTFSLYLLLFLATCPFIFLCLCPLAHCCFFNFPFLVCCTDLTLFFLSQSLFCCSLSFFSLCLCVLHPVPVLLPPSSPFPLHLYPSVLVTDPMFSCAISLQGFSSLLFFLIFFYLSDLILLPSFLSLLLSLLSCLVFLSSSLSSSPPPFSFSISLLHCPFLSFFLHPAVLLAIRPSLPSSLFLCHYTCIPHCLSRTCLSCSPSPIFLFHFSVLLLVPLLPLAHSPCHSPRCSCSLSQCPALHPSYFFSVSHFLAPCPSLVFYVPLSFPLSFLPPAPLSGLLLATFFFFLLLSVWVLSLYLNLYPLFRPAPSFQPVLSSFYPSSRNASFSISVLLPGPCFPFFSLTIHPASSPCFFCLYVSVLLPVSLFLVITPCPASCPFFPFCLPYTGPTFSLSVSVQQSITVFSPSPSLVLIYIWFPPPHHPQSLCPVPYPAFCLSMSHALSPSFFLSPSSLFSTSLCPVAHQCSFFSFHSSVLLPAPYFSVC
ncbi:uncharacterized protein LOC126047030 [Accipiter gentilis]|uniref:uncharacterized protein LOC126047030 n=1 Tax=Astur gentilis TaxID=8957 RepID=UPI00211054AE|nr:uncharacterized protein LOC126047030 [Accipiter gentilis]XP_049676141.1 uncharacterized protein LOC126047030 [Accipiter gentilis]XP_049676142.1 uncharacterized protein LOC126047030 [Accipiter gentilis]XP_049676144.1 uncharacterized protein LOC126047030 [Accipiter gentilis]XP_049676145.1 uncharacterized protein LOC126047030 [Accipiter gentilis]